MVKKCLITMLAFFSFCFSACLRGSLKIKLIPFLTELGVSGPQLSQQLELSCYLGFLGTWSPVGSHAEL